MRYRADSPAHRRKPPHELEIVWTPATFFLFMFIFWWAAASQLGALAPPKHALEIHVLAKQWMWKVQQPNGVREINEMHAPVGAPVRLVMTSQDVIHSMFLPALRIKQDVLPGRYTYLWFNADKPGIYHLLCAEFCGTDHSRMTGRLVLMTPADYARWLAAAAAVARPAAQGRDAVPLARMLRLPRRRRRACTRPISTASTAARCSLPTAAPSPPTRPICAIRSCEPRKDIVAGYRPIMPSFRGIVERGPDHQADRLSEVAVDQIEEGERQ